MVGRRLIAIYNSVPGVMPVGTFQTAKAGAGKIWGEIQGLGKAAEAPAKPRAGKKANGATAKGKGTKKAAPAKPAPKAKKSPGKEESAGLRESSKTSQVAALLQRKHGATLSEIVEKMAGKNTPFAVSWQAR